MKRIGSVVARVRNELESKVASGISTLDLDLYAEEMFKKLGARSAPRQTYNFPGSTCISVNDEAAHGIPSTRILKDGDIVNLDISASKDGFFADSGTSVIVGKGHKELEALLDCSKKMLRAALDSARPGVRLALLGKAMQEVAEQFDFGVIKRLSGHGIGTALHESPRHIHAYYRRSDLRILKEGMVLALESFVSLGTGEIKQLNDGWTLSTVDRKPAAQYEHTIVITKDKPFIFTK